MFFDCRIPPDGSKPLRFCGSSGTSGTRALPGNNLNRGFSVTCLRTDIMVLP